MVIKEAINIISQALEIANKKGAFTLDDAAIVKQGFDAVKVYVKEKEETVNAEPNLQKVEKKDSK